MRKLLALGALIGAVAIGCESKTPTGPGTITVDQATTTTVPATTTTVPGTGTPTTTTAPPGPTPVPPTTTITRRFVGSSNQPTIPNDMTLFFQLLFPGGQAPAAEGMSAPMATAGTYTVTGVYRTAAGSGGIVKGEATGDVDVNGQFSGVLLFDAPGCTAEREFSGPVSASILVLTGGRTLRDCKDTPLGWSSVTLVGGNAAPPITTTTPTTIAPPCTYGISPTAATITAAGGAGDVDVTTQPGCSWSAQSFVPWVSVQTSGAPTGNGRARYTVQPNDGPQRRATLLIAGQAFTLTQLAPGQESSTTTSSSSTSSSSTTTTSVGGPGTTTSTTSSTTTSTTSTSTSTSTSTTSTTTSTGISFASFVYPNMLAPPLVTACVGCHAAIGGSAPTARTWAMDMGRSDTTTSNFVAKPSGLVAHGGGAIWNTAQRDAAVNWILGGRQP